MTNNKFIIIIIEIKEKVIEIIIMIEIMMFISLNIIVDNILNKCEEIKI